MQRIHNWDVALVEFALDAQGQQFNWGWTDCASLARRGIIHILGEDVWFPYIGRWNTQIGALRIFKKLDIGRVLKRTGAHEVTSKFACAGDVAVGPNRDINGLIQIAIILPSHKVLTSSIENGVTIEYTDTFVEKTKYWRYV